MSEEKVSKDMAEQEFNRFCNLMDLDSDVESMDDDDRDGFNNQKRRMVRAIQKGSMVINEGGEPVFTPQRSGDFDAITFYEPTGATYMSMDRKKKDQDMGKVFTMMGDMCKLPPARLSKLKGSDVKICQAVITLFLG